LIVTYSQDLAIASRTIASEVRAGKLKTNSAIRKRYFDLTTVANDRKKATDAKNADARMPPDAPPDPVPWDEQAAGFGGVR